MSAKAEALDVRSGYHRGGHDARRAPPMTPPFVRQRYSPLSRALEATPAPCIALSPHR